MSTPEHRRHARLDMALSVNYAIYDDTSPASEMAETLSSDISASGLRLMTVAPLENGAILNLEISLPEIPPYTADPIRAKGEVVWQNKISDFSYETGTVIKYMEEQDKARLMSFVFDQISRLIGVSFNTPGNPSGNPTGGSFSPSLN